MSAMCWNIWKARNNVIFHRMSPQPVQTANSAISEARLWSANPPTNPPSSTHRNPTSTGTPSEQTLHPCTPNPPPPSICLQIHCDGSFLNDSQKAAYGLVVSNADGSFCDGKSGLLLCSSPIVAEARAILETVSYASQSTGHAIVKSDCQALVNCLKGSINHWPWECYGYLGTISSILRDLPNIKLQFSPRRRNQRADWVAKNTRMGSLPPDWRAIVCSLFPDE